MEVCQADEILAKRHPLAKWNEARSRLQRHIDVTPRQSFKFRPNPKVFTIGSCFARNIEEHLSIIGCDVPTLKFVAPKSEWRGRANGILNKYTPAAIYQEVAWAHRIKKVGGEPRREDFEEMRWRLPGGRSVDLELGGLVPVSDERFDERRFQVYETFAEAFTADCVTITLGLVEAWRHRASRRFIQGAPATRELRPHASEFDFVRLDYPQCQEFLIKTIDLITELNPHVKILITTSPVPMEKTFTQEDVIIANMTSKSILRAVAGSIERPNVNYFPSYETVALADRQTAYEADGIHVRDAVVAGIVRKLVDDYFVTPSTIDRLIQMSAAALGTEGSGKDSFLALRDAVTDMATLKPDQLVVFIRACWRLRDRARVRLAAEELLRRPVRLSAHMRSVSNALLKSGHADLLRRYAKDVLQADPENPIAQRLIDTA